MELYDEKGNVVKLYMPNLLINGDFQINQRGQSEYTGNNVYTVDMWKNVNNGTKIIVNDGYIVIDNTNFSNIGRLIQTTDIKANTSTHYVFKVKINDGEDIVLEVMDTTIENSKKVGDCTIIVKGNSNGYINCEIRVDPQKSVSVEYVDLFEGSIAYPHVKEDYATALMRCQRYLIVYNGPTVLGIAECQTTKYARMCLHVGKMNSTPSIAFQGNFTLYQYNEKYNTISDLQLVQNYSNGDSLWINLIGESFYDPRQIGMVYISTEGYLCISCEPQ